MREKIRSGRGTIEKNSTGVTIKNVTSGKDNEQIVSRFLAKAAVNLLVHRFGSGAVRLSHPELIEYVQRPRNKADVWPYYAVYTSLKPVAFAGLATKPSLIIQRNDHYRFAWLITASGFFSIPLDRNSTRSLKEAKDHIDNKMSEIMNGGGQFGMMASYVAENQSGKAIGKKGARNTSEHQDQ